MHLRAFCLAAVLASFACLAPPLAGAAEAGAHFDEAVKAFRAGDYDAALRRFLQARESGLDTPGLHYNLGVTYYRLRRYAEAESAFQSLARDPQWRALARYNLGLTAQRTGDARLARVYFDQAHRATTDPNLRQLASVALERLASASLPPRAGTLLALGGGYDSNPAIYTDSTAPGSRNGGDYFGELLGVSTLNLGGDAALGWNAFGALVLRHYLDQDAFDLQGLRAGISRDTDADRLQTSIGGNYGVVYLDGALLEQAMALDLQARRRLEAGGDLRASYHLARIGGGSGYRQLDGWQQRVVLDTGFAWRRALWRAGIQVEIEDRRDLARGGEFLSYSPQRHGIFVTAELPDVAGWRADLRLDYRTSRYRDPYRLDGGSRVLEREDERTSLVLRGSREAGTDRRVFVEISHYRNDSSIDDYDYRRGQLLLGIELVLEKAR